MRAPFRFDGGRRGVLLLHGFTGTPFEMRPLGEHLARRGYSVVGPALAGHAGTLAALGASRAADWLASAEAAFDELRARTDAVAVVGLSMGALLTVELARRRGEAVAAVALLAPALRLPSWLERLVTLVGRSGRLGRATLPKWGGSDIADAAMRAQNPTMTGFPIGAVVSLVELMRAVRPHLGEVWQPAFVAHGRRDHTIPFDCLAEAARDLGSDAPTVLALERSRHVITLDVERELLFERLDAFLARHLDDASPDAAPVDTPPPIAIP